MKCNYVVNTSCMSLEDIWLSKITGHGRTDGHDRPGGSNVWTDGRADGRIVIIMEGDRYNNPLWARISKNTDWSTGSLACPYACSLAPLTRSLTPHYSLRSRAPLRSFACTLAYFAHSLPRGTVIDSYLFCVFFY